MISYAEKRKKIVKDGGIRVSAEKNKISLGVSVLTVLYMLKPAGLDVGWDDGVEAQSTFPI